jgi:ABC-type uncharacterized transport system fused permease/ATPase subunit
MTLAALQAGFAFGRIEGALSIIVSSLERLAGLAAETERLHELVSALQDHGADFSNADGRPTASGMPHLCAAPRSGVFCLFCTFM